MSNRSQKIFTEKDWDDGDTIDRIYIYLMEPDRWCLSIVEERMLDALRKVWAIVCDKPSQRARIRLISEQIDVSERSVQRYIKDAILLFGDILKVDMDLELSLAHSRYMKLYQKAMKAEEFDVARRCQDSAVAILEKIEARQPKSAKQYAKLTFTDDPKALRARNAEDLEFEYVDNGRETSVLERQAVGVPARD